MASSGFLKYLVADPAHCPGIWAAECAATDPSDDAQYQLVDYVQVADQVQAARTDGGTVMPTKYCLVVVVVEITSRDW